MNDKLILSKKDFLNRNEFIAIKEFLNCGDEIEIDIDTAKKLYQSLNSEFALIKVREWLVANYPLDVIKWNEELLRNKLLELETKIKRDGFKFDHQTLNDLVICLYLYTNNKELVERLVRVVEESYKMNNGVKYCLTAIIGENSTYKGIPSYLIRTDDDLLNHFFPGTYCRGLIYLLFYNHFDDLLKEVIDNLLIPITNHSVQNHVDRVVINTYVASSVKNRLDRIDKKLSDYYLENVDNRIKRIKPCKQKEVTSSIGCLCYWNQYAFWIDTNNGKIGANFYCVANNIYVTNLSFVKLRSSDNFYVEVIENKKIKGLEFEKVNLRILKEDSINDLVFLTSDDFFMSNVYSSDVSLNVGDFIKIDGVKSIYNKSVTISDNDLINGGEQYYNSAMYDGCVSYGFVTKVDQDLITVDAPFSRETYGMAAYNEEGEFVGLVKSSLEAREYVDIVPYKTIFDALMKIVNPK